MPEAETAGWGLFSDGVPAPGTIPGGEEADR